jgi:MFS family permease
MAMAVIGLLLSWIWVKDTRHYVHAESGHSTTPRLQHIFRDTSWKHPQLGSITQAGLINNLNDGMAWGLFPLILSNKGFSLTEIGIITATYPAVWGFGQLITGKMSDQYCKKDLLFWGMMLQAVALFMFARLDDFKALLFMSALLGWGTAMVYPTFLAGIAENTHPADRAKSLGVFRFWRDLGYAIGAIITGLIAQWLGIAAAIIMVAILTLASALIIYVRMQCKPKPHATPYSLNPSKHHRKD